MKRNYWYTGLSGWFRKTFVGSTGSGVRAKDSRGRFIADDKSTAEKNEAYEDGKTPADRNKRARTKKGKYKADDKSTKRRNEAYKGGKSHNLKLERLQPKEAAADLKVLRTKRND